MMGEYTILAKQLGLQEVPQELPEKKNAKVSILSRNCLTTLSDRWIELVNGAQIGSKQDPGATNRNRESSCSYRVEFSRQFAEQFSRGPNAGTCPAKEIECLQRPPAPSSALQRPPAPSSDLRNDQNADVINYGDLEASMNSRKGYTDLEGASQETEDALSARVLHPRAAPSSTLLAKHGSIGVAAEEPPSETPAKPPTLNDHDERNRGCLWKRCSLIGSAVIGVAAVALWRCR
ncbi:hypothetical protein BSKO_02524 [Bryopsis sp. KO-2023]|nr:hypothetical protein BSKO_02524 [Bryopsis sp. KO-2023]